MTIYQPNMKTALPLDLTLADASTAAQWDAFVVSQDDSTFFHRYGWAEVLASVYGVKPYYFIAKSAGEIKAVLPLIYLSSPFFGKSLVATAFTVGGGVLGEPVAAKALLEQAARLGEELGVGYVELRGGQMPGGTPGWIAKSETYASFIRDLPEAEDDNLKAIPRKKRADIRKGIKALGEGKVEVEITDEHEVWPLYAMSVRNLGTPVFPRKLMTKLAAVFGQDVEMSVVHHGGQNVAGLLSFYHKDTVLPYYGGAAPAARGLHAYDLMYWAQMRRAVDRGMTKFDFGRSKLGTGAFSYKTFWGFEPEALVYHYHLVKAKDIPDINPNNPKFKLISETWRKLPLPVANRLGPLLARNLG